MCHKGVGRLMTKIGAFVPGDLLGPNQSVGGCANGGRMTCRPRTLKVTAARGGSGKTIDFQHDIDKDVELAHRQGYVSVEHLKRYTMLGMAINQGKTANIARLP